MKIKNKILTGMISLAILAGGCVSNSPSAAIELQTQASLTTSAFLIATPKDDRKAVAKKIYDLCVATEQLASQGVGIDQVKVFALEYALNSTDPTERAAIESLVNSIAEYLKTKVDPKLKLTEPEKVELILAAIKGIKQSVEPFLR